MPDTHRKKAEETLLQALACGATVDTAARQTGLSKRTIYRRLADPKFGRQVQELSADMVRRTARMLTAAGGESVKTLLELQKPNQPAATRMGAAKAVLDSGPKLREAVELEERIAAL